MSKTEGISIFYLSIGSGHQIAAEALAHALAQAAPETAVTVTDPFSEVIENLPAILDNLQSASIVLTPSIYDLAWRRGSAGNLFERVAELDLLQDMLRQQIDEIDARTVVATHVMPTAMAVALKREGLIDRVFGVATDYGLHAYWPLEDVDGYFVGHEDLRQTFGYRGFPLAKVHVTGIPLRLAFQETAVLPREKHPKLRVLLVAGGVRGGGYVELRQTISEILEVFEELDSHKLQLTVVTGNQERLKRRLDEYAADTRIDLRVLGFVSDIQRLMVAHDILIGKPGGLLVTEALASGLAMILLRPGPGQERANVDFLARHGAALSGETPRQAFKALIRCLADPERVPQMQACARALGKPASAVEAARHILSA
jgi:processive 1,2-diacylglycerol beta-glucosyltransferase